LNALLRSMKQATVSQLPELATIDRQYARGNPVQRLFAGGLARSTILIWLAFFLLMFNFYFVLSWTPKLLVAAGLSNQQGITGGVLLNVGGVIGGVLFGFLSSKLRLKRLTAAYLVITAAALVLFGLFASQLDMAFTIAVLIGAFIFGSMAGLYALAPRIYPAAIRTTGMGWSIGIGRVGAILAPTVVGFLIDGGWKTADLYYVFSIPLIVAMLTVLAIKEG